ncbi:PREDICTED: E3 ubiquitin-protein ligase LRSAM1-like [Ceratosolen solmsi marchali]|uniref:E3 ubiquitin-protein ligase LRSAM1-like n=1 Tax=Ceratosolen solmsi marchali TaxID=326594 RepID=A0AAJ6VM71_9HYME|nr:PREDICTED: E3 ubiquitin-protein ligase LRSAM1-like [Ceratosolen solmsi marchali]
MSIVRKLGSKSKVDYKTKLEHKLYLARMSPSSTYDISECNLENVPSSTYILCDVLRKETLLMQRNKLKSLSGGGALKYLSLITVLDVQSNELNNLPSDIAHLISLKELYLQENSILKLPNEIVHLKNLSILDISKNKLKCLPEAIGELKNLIFLNLSHNKSLQKLPTSLGYAQLITQLGIDGLKLSYPSEEIQSGGTIVIIAFLANECGINYSPENCFSESEKATNSKNIQMLTHNKDNDIQATLSKLDKMKEQRQTALLEVEENIKQQQKQELEMQNKLKLNKKKLLSDLVDREIQLQKEIEKVQHEKDSNRSRLLSYIYNAKTEANNVIKEFLHNSEKERQTHAELLEIEKNEEMLLLSRSHSEQSLHRTKDTLFAMKELLEDELCKGRKLAKYTAYKNFNAQSLLSIESKSNDQLLQVMQDQEKSRQDLVIKIKEDEHLQKVVVTALLERSDARSWSIVQQVNLVQSQLTALTNIELGKKKLQINQHINDVADKRIALSAILINLLEQQEQRRQQLLETMKQIEEQRNISALSKCNSSFWLLQYQKLIETRPQGLLETLDSALVRNVAMAGVLHCLPFLWALPSLLPNLDDEKLKSMGIANETDRVAILIAIENYLEEKKLKSCQCSPSAPLEDEPCTSFSDSKCIYEPSAPAECTVCMEIDCEVIFLPCGHLCCCAKCADMILIECPMCRTTIDRKIKITKQ